MNRAQQSIHRPLVPRIFDFFVGAHKESFMDMATIRGACDAVAFVKKALEAFVDFKANAKANEKVAEASAASKKFSSHRVRSLAVYRRRTHLSSSNYACLSLGKKGQPRMHCERLQAGAIVYRSDGSSEHFACPRCYERIEIQIFQDHRDGSGGYSCPSCHTKYPVKPRENSPLGVAQPRGRRC